MMAASPPPTPGGDARDPLVPGPEAVAMPEQVVHQYHIPGIATTLCIGLPPWRPAYLGWCMWIENPHSPPKVLAEFDVPLAAQATVLFFDSFVKHSLRAIEAARQQGRSEAATRRTYPY